MRVDELKNKILQLAIQGKLVPQDSNDEPASVLLERIKEEKEQLIKEKKIKKEKPLPEISEEEKSFEIPDGWEWCRTENIITLISGRDLSSNLCNSEGIGIPYILGASSMTDVGIIIERWVKNPTVIGIKGDIMISVKGTVGKLEIINLDQVHLSRQVMSIRTVNELLSNKYILLYLKSYMMKLKEKSSGVIPGISREDILALPFALPPLQEQKRIVAKVDELFSIIDKLGENKEALSKNIDITRDKVLQLAIQGKLVPQDPDDEPASVLLEKIKKEKEQLIKEKKIKKEKPLPEISEEEKAFEIPKGWEWCRVGSISNIKGGKRVPAGYKLLDTPTNHIYIRVADMKNGTIVDDDIKYISKDIYDKIRNYYIESDDIYITIAGTIGRVGTIPKRFNRANLTENAAKISCYFVDKEYIYRILNSNFVQEQILTKTKKVGQPKLALNQIESLILPIPPIQEQKRIVAKIDEIMGYLDKLQNLINGKSLGIEGVQAKEIALSKAEELV